MTLMPEIEPEKASAAQATLELPDWLPQPVAIFAHSRRRQGGPEVRDLLRRLVFDPRMKNVWNELQRRKRENYRSTEKFVHSLTQREHWFSDTRYALQYPEKVRGGGSPPPVILANYHILFLQDSCGGQGRNLSERDLAMAYLFEQAFTLALMDLPLVPISELRKKRSNYRKMAKQLRADAIEQERLGLYESQRFVEAALAYEELAGRSRLVKRQPRGDARLKRFVMALADITKNVFGSPLYGSVATIANVVFSRDDLTSGRVRKMLPRTVPLRARGQSVSGHSAN
jgi:hypothetical protein